MIYKTRNALIFLLILLVSFSNLNAQKLEYSRDGQTLAALWTIDFAVGEDISQFLFYDTKIGKINSSMNISEPAKFLLFSNDAKNLLISDRLLLDKIGFNERNEANIVENKNSIENLVADRKQQDYINTELLDFALSADGQTIYKLFSNYLNAYSFPDLKYLPAKSRVLELKKPGEKQNRFAGISRDGQFVFEIEDDQKNSSLLVKENGKPDAFRIKLSPRAEEDEFPSVSAIASQNNGTLMIKSVNETELSSQINFWNLKTRERLADFSIPMLDKNYPDEFYPLDAVAVSPDGKKAAAKFETVDEAAQMVSMIAVFDIYTKKTVFIKVKAESGLRFAEAIAFSPDSKNLATLSSVVKRASYAAQLEIWNTEDGKKIKQFE